VALGRAQFRPRAPSKPPPAPRAARPRAPPQPPCNLNQAVNWTGTASNVMAKDLKLACKDCPEARGGGRRGGGF
jgi:hypothetical protein